MSEQATAEQVQVSAEQPTTEVKTETFNPFASNSWVETLPEEKTGEIKSDSPVIEQKKEEAAITDTTNEEIIEPKEWLKREFDIDDVAVLKAEREEFKKLKEQKPQGIKFEDEQSQQIYELLREGGDKKKEVRKFLETQEKIETLINSDVNEDNAADIIKLGMQLKYKDLKPDEIEYKFKKQFGLPKEPVLDVDDEDSVAAHNEWKEKVADIKMNLSIEAKLAKPDLEKAKIDLKLPEITKNEVQMANEPTPEVLKEIRDNFLNKLESDYIKTEGFSTQVKDELVEIPVTFKIPDEDKVAIKGRLEEGFEVDEYINKRWFGEKGEPKIEQIIADIYQLENFDKVLSGVANNAANLRLLEARKQSTNADINGKTHQNTFQPNADGKANISPFKKEAWSETPPVFT